MAVSFASWTELPHIIEQKLRLPARSPDERPTLRQLLHCKNPDDGDPDSQTRTNVFNQTVDEKSNAIAAREQSTTPESSSIKQLNPLQQLGGTLTTQTVCHVGSPLLHTTRCQHATALHLKTQHNKCNRALQKKNTAAAHSRTQQSKNRAKAQQHNKLFGPDVSIFAFEDLNVSIFAFEDLNVSIFLFEDLNVRKFAFLLTLT